MAELTNLQVRAAVISDVREFLEWRYAPPYDVYDLIKVGATDEQIAAEAAYFLDPETRCHVICDEGGALVGFCTFGQDGQVPGGDYSAGALDIGLGMRPELTGQGNGRFLVRAVIDFAVATWQPPQLRVTIAEFNRRAQRVWRQAGFVQTQRFVATKWTKRPFLIFVKRFNS